MREWEQATWTAGATEADVIARVGRRVAQVALRLTNPGDRLLLLAGKGNNGQDVRASVNHLDSRSIELLSMEAPEAGLAALEKLLSPRPALIIDGLFGIGLNRPLNSQWCALLRRVNESGVPVLSLDVPSGLDAGTGKIGEAAIEAAVTLTVGAPKTGMLLEEAWPYVGRLEVADGVGLVPPPFTTDLQWTLPSDFTGFPPARPAATHKGTYGHLAILAGSLGFHGAAVLATRGAQRAQPGLVTLHTLESTFAVVASQLQAAMVAPWQMDTKLQGPWSAILIGPGLAGQDVSDKIRLLTRQLWCDSTLPLVVDASALDWLPLDHSPRAAIRVITPHPGEAARLLQTTPQKVQANRSAALRKLSEKFGDAWVVLKGHQTLVGRSTGPVYFNCSGNPHMAQGGSGDLLAGYIAGLLAQPPLRADVTKTVRYAVWQHGAAADLLQAARRNWIVEDLADALGNARPDQF